MELGKRIRTEMVCPPIFETVDEAKMAILYLRREKPYKLMPPYHSMSEDDLVRKIEEIAEECEDC